MPILQQQQQRTIRICHFQETNHDPVTNLVSACRIHGLRCKKTLSWSKEPFVRLDEVGPLSLSLLFVQKMAADGFSQLSMLFHFSCWVIIYSPIGHTMQKASAYWFLQGDLPQLVIFGWWNGGGHICAWHLHQIWRVIAYVMKAENDNCGGGKDDPK